MLAREYIWLCSSEYECIQLSYIRTYELFLPSTINFGSEQPPNCRTSHLSNHSNPHSYRYPSYLAKLLNSRSIQQHTLDLILAMSGWYPHSSNAGFHGYINGHPRNLPQPEFPSGYSGHHGAMPAAFGGLGLARGRLGPIRRRGLENQNNFGLDVDMRFWLDERACRYPWSGHR